MENQKLHKFRLIIDGAMSGPYTLEQLAELKPVMDGSTRAVQCLGFCDANKQDLYEGDVLELKITEELMDHGKNTFYNSNLGKAIERDRSILSVICVFKLEKEYMGCSYQIHFLKEDGIQNTDGAECEAFGDDFMFPIYLCKKGAECIGNLAVEPGLLGHILGHTGWKGLKGGKDGKEGRQH